jgi:hypothetical protein
LCCASCWLPTPSLEPPPLRFVRGHAIVRTAHSVERLFWAALPRPRRWTPGPWPLEARFQSPPCLTVGRCRNILCAGSEAAPTARAEVIGTPRR